MSCAGRAMSGMLWYVIHWPLSCGNRTQLHSSQPRVAASDEAGPAAPGAGASHYCVLSPVCLLGSSPDWHGHLGRPGHVLWMIERWKTTTVIDRHFFSYFAAFFRLNCLNQCRSHRRPYLLHCCAVLPHQSEGGVFKSRGSSLLHRAVPCCSPR